MKTFEVILDVVVGGSVTVKAESEEAAEAFVLANLSTNLDCDEYDFDHFTTTIEIEDVNELDEDDELP